MLDFKEPKQTAQPAIYFVSLHAIMDGKLFVYEAAVAAFTIETAKTEAIVQLQNQDPTLYQQGLAVGGWNMKQHIELTGIKIDTMLVKAYDGRDEAQKRRESAEKNELMQTIIDTASRKLLNKYIDLFTPAEVGYMEEEIQKYDTAS